MSEKKRLFLVDAYALIFRSYYAMMRAPMRNNEGINTSPIFGFTRAIHDIIRREHPHYLGVAFDSKGDTFRHELAPDYKANRSETPEDIHASVPHIKEILKAMRIPILEMPGWEADDIIGTIAHKADKEGFEVYMVTPDKDFGQLVDDNVYMYKQLTGGQGVEIIDRAKIKEMYGIDDPKLLIDILALWGDASDNIAGVAGIGEKNASRLVAEYGDVDQIIANVDKLTPKQRENILASREQIALSKVLATIDLDVPVEFKSETLIIESPDCVALEEVYKRLNFSSFLRDLQQGDDPTCGKNVDTIHNGKSVAAAGGTVARGAATGGAATAGAAAQKGAIQGSLFDTPTSTVAKQVAERITESAERHGDMETLESVTHTYHHIKEQSELQTLVAKLSECKEFAFDTETTGLDTFNDRMIGISFCIEPFESWYVTFDRDNQERFTQIIKPLFENDKIAKIGQNIKFDIMVLANLGVEVRGFMYDTMLLHYLLDAESRHNMDYLANVYLNYQPIGIESLIGKGAKQISLDMVQPDTVARYGAEDADVTMRLKRVLWDKVVEQGMVDLYEKIEEPLIGVLAEIEMNGVRIDSEVLSRSGEELTKKLDELESKIKEFAGSTELNVNSPKQLGEVLFDSLKIDPNPKKTKTKQYRTDEEYLTSLKEKSPIIEWILQYRGLKKLLSTYITALPLLVNAKTGRIHTSFNQAVTSTGRLSSSNPNLQNIPVREANGREIRRAFVPTDERYLLLAADYSQVELRLMAHLSEDENLLNAFKNGEDIHSSTASLLFNVPIEEVTSDQRRKAKTANFGIIYGISAFGLSQRLDIPRQEASEIIKGYFTSYPGVNEYMTKVVEQAKSVGYVSTIFGRKRWLPDIASRNAVARGLAERNAINAPIQGSAADIVKIAMVEVSRKLREGKFLSKMILQVHDELVIDLYKEEEKQVTKIVLDAMENAAKLKVELTVDYSIGDNWMDI